jgi:hypothetical protein
MVCMRTPACAACVLGWAGLHLSKALVQLPEACGTWLVQLPGACGTWLTAMPVAPPQVQQLEATLSEKERLLSAKVDVSASELTTIKAELEAARAEVDKAKKVRAGCLPVVAQKMRAACMRQLAPGTSSNVCAAGACRCLCPLPSCPHAHPCCCQHPAWPPSPPAGHGP